MKLKARGHGDAQRSDSHVSIAKERTVTMPEKAEREGRRGCQKVVMLQRKLYACGGGEYR
jgi:hypothetical protein